MIRPGEIVYCDLGLETIEKKPQKYLIKRVSLSIDYDEVFDYKLTLLKNKRILDKHGIKTDCKIIKILIHHSSGFKSNTKEFTEVKASDEKRNKITGAYE